MGLFEKKKREAQQSPGGGAAAETAGAESARRGKAGDGIRSVKVLGSGCKTCHEQYQNARTAVGKLGLNVEVEHITDLEEAAAYGVMSMPAVVINEKVVSAGRVLRASEVEKLLQKAGV